MQSEGLVVVLPKTGGTVTLLRGTLAPSSAPGNPLPPTASKKTDHVSRKQSYEQTPGNTFPPTASTKTYHISRKQSYERTSKPNQSKLKLRSRSYLDHDRVDKSRQYLEKRLRQNYDVRYINTFKRYFDKFIEFSKPTTCDQLECPSLQERLNHHRSHHHGNNSPWHENRLDRRQSGAGSCCKDLNHNQSQAANEPCCQRDTRDVIRRFPNGCTKKFTASEENKGNHSVQTKITFADLGHLTISIEPEGIPVSRSHVETDKAVNFKCMDAHNCGQATSRTRFDVECNKNEYFYKDNLKDEINKWILHVPFYRNTTPKAQLEKDNTINKLLERICDLVSEVDNPNYQQMIAYEIYQCLDDLKIWYPGAKRDQSLFKEGLCLNLWIAIKDVNDKWLGYRNYNSQKSKRPTNCDFNQCRTTTRDDQSVRCTVNSHRVCDTNVKTRKGNCSPKNISCKDNLNCEISDWLTKYNLYRPNCAGMSKRTITNILLNRLQPYLNDPITDTKKNILRSKIVEILEDLPNSLNCPGNTGLLTKFADDLTNRILWIQAKFESNKCKKCVDRTYLQYITQKRKETKNIKKQDFHGELRDCLTNLNLKNQKLIEEEILDIILENMESIRIGKVQDVESDILILLQESGELTHAEMSNIVKCVVDNLKNIVLLDPDNIILQSTDSTSLLKPCESAILSIYASEHGLVRSLNTPVNSNKSPKQQASEKNTHVNKVTKIIKNWAERLPQKTKTDKKHKETMIDGLVDAITDQTVLQQIAIEQKTDKNSAQKYLINQFLANLNLAEDDETEHHVLELLNKFKEIPTPVRSTINYQECEASCSLEYFVSKMRVSLPDVITIWVNEQPSKIYSNNDTKYRNKKIQELTAKLQPLIENNRPDKEKSVAIAEWLQEMLTNQDRKKINAMAVNLTERLKKVPLEETAAAEAKLFAARENILTASDKIKERELSLAINESTSYHNALETFNKDPDEIMKEFIMKFIQHNSNVEDTTARSAFAELLETEIQKCCATSRKEIYDGFLKSPQNNFSPIRLDRELKYIKDITEWLKNIPIESTYNARGNKKRIDFCLRLAGDIASVESDRLHRDDNNSKNLEAIIGQYMTQLPIHSNQRANINLMIHQLLNKIISRRQKLATAEENYALTNPNPNLTDFIEDYVCINGQQIAEDDLELEAWSDRLLKEVKQIACSHDPVAFTKTGVYHRLAEQKPEETVKDFNVKLSYVEEISDWMKNLPLLHATDESRAHLIKELAEKIAETKRKKAFKPNDTQAEVELENYINNWISKLPLDRNKEVIIPIVIKQLLNRVEKVNLTNLSIDNVIGLPKVGCCSYRTAWFNLPPPSSSISNLSKSVSKKLPKSPKSQGMPNQNHPASWIVKSVEDWTTNLPIEGGDEKDIKAVKTDIAKKLYQKIGELNVNQRFYKDSVLYNDVISDEIDVQLEKLPRNMILKGDKNKIKGGLLQIIADSKRKINEKTAGDIYKQRLENTIESSMPHPVQIQNLDLGFEIYKNRLASMFIVENFDHGNEVSKRKCERQLKRVVDKYFKNAQSKNAILLTKDQIYNELYSSLYKVPTPNKSSLIQEVEEIKMKCEIDDWFEELPLVRSADASELLQWDNIRSTLAKRLHEMENDPKPTDNKHKEISKWLTKLPFQPGENIDELANKLEIKLKSSPGERTRLLPSDKNCKFTFVFSNEGYPNSSDNTKNMLPKPIPKKSADLTIEIIEDWCNQLPIPTNKILKGDIVTKIIIKVSELNSDPGTFNDDLLYKHLLDKELDKILATLPVSSDLIKSKDERKYQLIEGLDSIKVVIREERARHEYRNDLNDTIRNTLEISTSNTAEKTALFNEFRDEVVDDFVEYYHRDDDAGKHFFKKKIHNTMTEYLQKTKDSKNRSNIPNDSMVKGNQLLCELSKVPIPNEAAVTEEVQEIRMKKQVREFFDTVLKDSKDKKGLRNQVQTSLAKRLNAIEKTGHNIENHEKIKREITRSLRKLGHEVSSQKIDSFIDKLKLNEMTRKTSLVRKYDSYPVHSNTPDWVNDSVKNELSHIKKKCCGLPNCKRSRKIQEQIDQTLKSALNFSNTSQQQPRSPGHPGPSDQAKAPAYHETPGPRAEHFISGSSPPRAPQYHELVGNNSTRTTRFDDSISPRAQAGGNVSRSPRDYSQFEDEVARSSSKSHLHGSFQPQAPSGAFQRSFGPTGAGAGPRDFSLGQQSFGPSDGSGNQWQSMLSSGGPQQFASSQGPVFPATPGGLVPPRGQNTSTSPYSNYGQGQQRPVGMAGVVPQPGQQSFGPPSDNGSQWLLASPEPQPAGSMPGQQSFGPASGGGAQFMTGSLEQQAQQSFGPASGSGSHWESLLASPEQWQGPMQSYPGQQSFSPGTGSGSKWHSQNEIPWQVQSSFGPPGAGVVPGGLMLGGQQQYFGPEPGSDAQWQSLYSTLGPQQFEIDQGRAQSPGILFPPQALETSTSPYTSSGQQHVPGSTWQQEAGRAGGQQTLGPESADNSQWQSQNEIPWQVQSSFGPPGADVVPRGLNLGEQQQYFGPETGGDAQWQSLYSTLGPPQLGTDQGRAQSPGRLFPPQALETSTSPYTSSGQRPLSGSQWQQEAGRAGGQQTFGPISADNSQWQSQNEIPWQVQGSFEPPGAGVVPTMGPNFGQEQYFGPETGSDAQWLSLFSTGPQQLGADQVRPQSPARLVPPRDLEISTSPYASGGQQPWQQRPTASGRGVRFQGPTSLLPPRGLESSISPYASGVQQPVSGQPRQQAAGGRFQGPTSLYPPRGLETSVSPYAIGPSDQRSARPGQWGYHEPYVDPQSVANIVYGPRTQGGVVDSLSESALGYPLFVHEVPLSSSRQDLFSSSFQVPSGQPMQNASPLPPRLVSNSMHPSGGSVQPWDTQSSAGPHVVQQRAQAMVHDQRGTMGPQRRDQILYDPYVSRQYAPGDVQSLQRGGGVQASLGQSGVEYQGFQAAGPLSSSLRQSLAPGQRTLQGPVSPSSAQRSIIVQQPSPGQAYQTQIPIIRSPQSTPSLFPSPQGSYRSPGPLRTAMHAPGSRHVDSTLIGPYLPSPASAPLITPGGKWPLTSGQGVPQDEVMSDEDCLCERQMRRRRRCPIRAIPLLEFCESCQDFGPFFRPMPLPGYFF